MNTVNIMSYGYGHLAAHCIESVLNQTKPFDVVRFYDDGAGDCAHLPKLYPEVEYVLREQNLGIVPNFNNALANTEKGRVMFLGADNWLHPSTLEYLSRETADIVSYDAWIVGDGPDRGWKLLYQAHGSALYDTERALDAGGYEASGNDNSEEDSVLFTKMRNNGASLAIVPKPLLFYRRHRANFILH